MHSPESNTTHPSSLNDSCRSALIGSGVAALSAARAFETLHFPFYWFVAPPDTFIPNPEVPLFGGILHQVQNPIHNLISLSSPRGTSLAVELDSKSKRLFHNRYICDPVTRITHQNQDYLLQTEAGTRVVVDALILATGTRYRRLSIPNEPPHPHTHPSTSNSAWYFQSASHCSSDFKDRNVLVVGGGDAALENALKLADFGANVFIASRSPFRARRPWISRAMEHDHITLFPIPTTLTQFTPTHPPSNDVRCIATLHSRLHGSSTSLHQLPFFACFIRIGVTPWVPTLPPLLKRDPQGFVLVSSNGETNLPGFFAAGDVTNTSLRSVASSAGDGAKAAHQLARYLGLWG